MRAPLAGAAAPGAAHAELVFAPVATGRAEVITWQRVALLSLALSLISLGTAASSLTAVYVTYRAANAAVTLSWVLNGCYSRVTGAAGGAAATVCDAGVPPERV